MNLWVKRIGQSMMAAALFFLSCEDPTQLGYPGRQRFKVSYIEIPLTTSVYQLDSVVTTNFLQQSSHRFLVGSYTDDVFGEVTSSTYTQFGRTSSFPDSLSYGIYDSVSIQLKFDISYTYGAPDVTAQDIAIYELDDTLANRTLFPRYISSNAIPMKAGPLGSASFTVDPESFRDFMDDADDRDTVITVRFPLATEFGERLFESAKVFQNPQTREDTISWTYSEFVKEFKGLAITPTAGDKIVSFDPLSSASKIVVHFHINKQDSIVLTFADHTSFNQIQADRAGTDLAAITEPFTAYDLPARYIENGLGIITKLDLSNFYTSFVDTLSAGTEIIINDAELFIQAAADPPETLPTPDGLVLRALDADNTFRQFETAQDTTDITDYAGTISTGFVMRSETKQNDLTLFYNGDDDIYRGHMALFVQELFRNREGARLTNFGLYPVAAGGTSNASIGRSVNRVVFDPGNVILRVTYTRPTAGTEDN